MHNHLIEYREKLLKRGHPPDHEAIIALEEQIEWNRRNGTNKDKPAKQLSSTAVKRVG